MTLGIEPKIQTAEILSPDCSLTNIPQLPSNKFLNLKEIWAAGMAQVVEQLPCNCKDLSSNSNSAGKKLTGIIS
jgi:hypothetical protein